MDHSVPLVQPIMFYDREVSLGAPVQLVVVENAVYEFVPVFDQSPTTDQVY